jgi:hypothetical protein
LPEISDSKPNNETINNTSSLFYFKKMAGASKKRNIKSLFVLLEKEKFIDTKSKTDFINAFTGIAPIKKIKWTGLFGDIKTLINYCMEKEFITKTRPKWITTSKIFTINDTDFDSKTIKDTATTNNEVLIKRLIDSIG